MFFYRSRWWKFADGNQEFWWPEQFIGVFFSCDATVPSVSHWQNFWKQGIKQLCLQICDMMFLWQCVLRLTFSSMWCGLVDWYQCVRGISCPHLQGGRCEDGDSRLLWNIESYLLGYVAYMWEGHKHSCAYLLCNFFILHVVHICLQTTGCRTCYRTWHCFNNSNTDEDIATKFEQEYVLSFTFLTQWGVSASNFVASSSLVVKVLKKCRVR